MTERATLRPALLHPVSIAAIGLLLLNDHLLKDLWPGVVTGKLSDLAGLVFFPLLLAYLVGLVVKTSHYGATVLAVVATGVVFSLIQLWEPAADLYRHAFGLLQFPFRFVAAGADHPVPVAHTADPSDLAALPALLIAWWAGREHRTSANIDPGTRHHRTSCGGRSIIPDVVADAAGSRRRGPAH